MKIQKDTRGALKFIRHDNSRKIWIFVDRIAAICEKDEESTYVCTDNNDFLVKGGIDSILQRISEFDH